MTDNLEELERLLARMLPFRVEDGRDYAEVYFGAGDQTHSTQAMTMNPQDWLDLGAALPSLIATAREVEGLRAEVDRLQKQVVALCVAKQRLERACIKAAAPDFLTEAEREALHDFVKFLKSTEGTEDRAALEGKGG